MNTDVRITIIFTGTYDECCHFVDERPVRKGELATIKRNEGEEDQVFGSHLVVIHEPPGRMRDAMDLLREFVKVDLYGMLDPLAELDELQSRVRNFIGETEYP